MRVFAWICAFGGFVVLDNLHALGLDWADRIQVVIFVALPFFLLASFFGTKTRPSEQPNFDKEAEKLLERIFKGSTKLPAFGLYLRPFFLSGAMEIKNPFNRENIGLYDFSWIFEAERLAVDEAIRRTAKLPLIKIGSAFDKAGAGVLRTSDETWKKVFDLATATARFIIAVPIASQSTTWEIGEIFRRKLHLKTIFLVPAFLKSGEAREGEADRGTEDAQQIWRYSRHLFRSQGAVFPPVPAGSVLMAQLSGENEEQWWIGPLQGVAIGTLCRDLAALPRVPNNYMREAGLTQWEGTLADEPLDPALEREIGTRIAERARKTAERLNQLEEKARPEREREEAIRRAYSRPGAGL